MEDDFEQRLAGMIGDSLEARIGEKIASFGGLLSRQAAVRLLCRENGIISEERASLSAAPGMRSQFSFSAKVDRVFPAQLFQGNDSSVRIHLSDQAGQATLVLWNEQARAAEALLAGDIVECFGAYFKSGEIGLSKNGRVIVKAGAQIAPLQSLSDGICTTSGMVKEVGAMREFLDRAKGEKRKTFSFSLCEGDFCMRAVVWGLGAYGGALHEGDSIVLENAFFKKGELHIGSQSRIVLKESAASEGEISDAEVKDGAVVFTIGGGRHSASLGSALSFLGISSLPDGVSQSTAAGILASAAKGRKARFFSKGGRLSELKLV